MKNSILTDGNNWASTQFLNFSLFVWLVADCWWLICYETKVLLVGD
jgi:hypothetical protein